MKIIADRQIPFVEQAFSTLGEVVLCEGRKITPEIVADADILLIRSVTPVTPELLQQSRVRFVASATSGIDHIDLDYLRSRDIDFCSAHGSNTQSVVEYVLSSICVLASQKEFNLSGKTAAIIGCGAVGSRVARALAALGVKCLLNDPPLHDATGNSQYLHLSEVMQADIITLHVPFTDTGLYPTRHLVDTNFLQQIKPDTILINTARGGVMDETAVLAHLHKHPDLSVVLDVWAHEPVINQDLLPQVAIGTPHIAGYSIDAKIRATAQVYASVCDYLDVPHQWQSGSSLLNHEKREFTLNTTNDDDAIVMAVLAHYDVRSDTAALRRILELDRLQAGPYFDALRKNYPLRREFPATTLRLPSGRLADRFRQLGFTVKVDTE